MRIAPLLLLLATTLTLPAQAPKASPKSTKPAEPAATPARKTLTFQPGAKAPDETDSAPVTAPAAPAGGTPPAVVPPAPPAKTGDDCLDLATAFFESLKRGLIDDAYTNLTKGSKIGDRPDELRSLKTKTSEAITLFGEIRGFETIESKSVGTMLRRYTIVSFGRDFPLRWRFYFYKAEDQWRLVDLHVDDRLAGIFLEQDEAAPAVPEPKQ